MTLVPLTPAPGLNSDDTSFSAQGRWADCSNVRFYNGKPQTIGGSAATITLTAGQGILEMTVVGGSPFDNYTIIGTADKLWSGSSLTAPANVSPAAFATTTYWSFEPYGNTVLCNSDAGLYRYTTGSGVAATKITQAPAQSREILVARRQVLAFACNEEVSTLFNPRCIRGSDIEDPTDWTTTSTNNAFEEILDDTGQIITAANVGDYVAVLTTTTLWMGSFIGDPSQTYRFERVDGAVGIVASKNAACTTGGVLYWLGFDLQVWQWSPGSLPVPIPCQISKVFRDSMGPTERVHLAAMSHFNEIWVFYIDVHDSTQRYIAFNRQGQWFRGTLDRDAVCTNGIANSLVQSNNPDAAGAFLAAKDNVVYSHELSGGGLSWSITSADQYLDNGKRRVQIQRFVPDFEDQAGDIALTLYMRDRPQSTAVTKGPYTVTNTATKKDFRASGMIVDAKFSGTTYARFGTPCFETVPMGER